MASVIDGWKCTVLEDSETDLSYFHFVYHKSHKKRHCLKADRLLSACATTWTRFIVVIYDHSHHIITFTTNNSSSACNFHFSPLEPAVQVLCRPFCHNRQFIFFIPKIHVFNFDWHFILRFCFRFLQIYSVKFCVPLINILTSCTAIIV